MLDSAKRTSAVVEALSKQYTAVTNNLANSNVSGFKRRLTTFVGDGSSSGQSVKGESAIDYSQGHLIQTRRNLDMALNGKGFFCLESPQGELYTRNGSFRVNSEGQLVDYSNRVVSGESGPIVIPKTISSLAINITPEGKVVADGRPLGKFKLTEFENIAKLKPINGNLFKAPLSAGAKDAENTTIAQGFQEASNVSVVEELVDLIRVSRLYEANMRTVNTDRLKTLLDVAMA